MVNFIFFYFDYERWDKRQTDLCKRLVELQTVLNNFIFQWRSEWFQARLVFFLAYFVRNVSSRNRNRARFIRETHNPKTEHLYHPHWALSWSFKMHLSCLFWWPTFFIQRDRLSAKSLVRHWSYTKGRYTQGDLSQRFASGTSPLVCTRILHRNSSRRDHIFGPCD